MQAEVDVVTRVLSSLVRILGLGLGAGVLGASIGLVHRWYARSRVPEGLSGLVGLTGVAAYLNTTSALGTLIADVTAPGTDGPVELLQFGTVAVNSLTLALALVLAVVGGRAGDRIGETMVDDVATSSMDVSRLVRTVGRVITVDLPTEIEDIDGYEPVSPAVKESLAGETLVFSRGLTVDELRSRLVERLKGDYGVGHVDVDVDVEGEVAYLAVGSRESGLGPTLPPETCALAVHADPAFAASAGDLVQVYRPGDDGPELVCTAELRGSADDVVTLAVDTADVSALDATTAYRLVTLPVEPRADREFAALLRSVEETMGVVTISSDSGLVGSTLGDVDAAVVAVRTAGGDIEPLPPRSRALVAEESLYVIARPDRLRKLDAAARSPEADND